MRARTSLVIFLFAAACTPPNSADEDGQDLICLTCGGDTGSDPPPVMVTCYRDADHDGYGAGAAVKYANKCAYGYVQNHSDCNDANAAITVGPRFYRDADGDGYGNPSSYVNACAQPSGYVTNADDCNDGSAATHPQKCSIDQDGDGYGADHMVCVASCPAAGYWGDGDCNDADPNIHPERYEVAENDVDDNCNQLTDESEFDFGNPANYSTYYITLDFAIEGKVAAARARAGQPLWAQVRYSPLGDTSVMKTQWGALTIVPPGAIGAPIPRSRFTVTALDPDTAYRFEVRLFTDQQLTQPLDAGTSWLNTPSAPVSSNVFYGMTLSTSPNPVVQDRPHLFQRIFFEWELSQRGVVKGGNKYCPGYNCDKQHGGDEWCSEFYNWAISPWYQDIWTAYHEYYGDIITAFSNAGSWTETDGFPNNEGSLGIGDYLAIGDPGNIHHSAMFVAYDHATGLTWQLSGNAGNRVGFGTAAPKDIQGDGMLNQSMLR